MMKITKKKPVKEVVKAKAKAIKKKVKGKVKGCAAVVAFLCLAVCGCMETQPASRATTATYGDMEADVDTHIGEKAHNNNVTVTVRVNIGDGALASADSSGSTETQTATPTMDIKPDIDVNYNDAIKNATDASKGVLETLVDSSAKAVLQMMSEKKSGTVQVTKADGSTATVECKDGQCSLCTDGSCTPTAK